MIIDPIKPPRLMPDPAKPEEYVRRVFVTDEYGHPAYYANVLMRDGETHEAFVAKLDQAFALIRELVEAKEGTLGATSSPDVTQSLGDIDGA